MLIVRLGTERRLPSGRDGRFGRFQPKQVFGLVKAALVAGLASNVDQRVLLVASAQPASLERECSFVQVGHIRGEFRSSQFLRGLELTSSPSHVPSGGSCPCSGDRSPCSSLPFHFCSSPTGKPVISQSLVRADVKVNNLSRPYEDASQPFSPSFPHGRRSRVHHGVLLCR